MVSTSDRVATYLSTAQRTTKKAVRSGLFFAPPLYRALTSEHRYLALHRLGRGHEPEFRLVADLLPPAPMVIDVGGNLGQSVLSVMACMPDAHVVSFEPNPGPRATLRRVAARFPSRVEVEGCGLGDEESTGLLHVPTYRGKEMAALASLDLTEAEGWISTDTVYFFDPTKLSVASLTVTTKRLDDFGFEPDLIKIDVQGFEHEVVLGGLATIDRHQPIIVAEAPTDEMIHLLADHGYSVVESDGTALRPSEHTQVNQVFLPARIPLPS